MKFDRDIYFDSVRQSLFGGAMKQSQIVGQNFILGGWEKSGATDVRHLGYELATTYHETAQEMLPIEEYGKGEGQPYGVKDPETGQTYYGRGFVQLTWRENYHKAAMKLGLAGTSNDLEMHADRALSPPIAADVMFMGMTQGWFTGKMLSSYFDGPIDDPFNARDIINGDKYLVPDWSNGVNMGNVIKGYYMEFTAALNMAKQAEPLVKRDDPIRITITLEILVSPRGATQVSVLGVE